MIDEDTNILSDIVNDEDSDYFIITHDNIATEDDFKEDEVSFNHAIHIVIKKCEQFFDEYWKNFQNFFMLSKKDNDRTDLYKLILFSDLEH